MALTSCRKCGSKVSTEAEACPHCGEASPHTVKQTASGDDGNSYWTLWAIYVGSLLCVSVVFVIWLLADFEQSSSQAASASSDQQSVKVTPGKKATSPSSVRKPESAESVLRGRQVSYGWWFDSDTWSVIPMLNRRHPAAEYGLFSKTKGVRAIVIPETTYVPMKRLDRVALSNVSSGASQVKLVSKARRRVNGTKMLVLTITGELKGKTPVTWHSYNYSSKEFGTIQLIAFTRQKFYEKRKSDMERLLGGLVVKGSGKASE